LSRLVEDGFSRDQIELERAAALHYQGQSFELEVPIPVGAVDRAALTALEEAYGIEHEKTYGHRAGADEPVELITLKMVGRGLPDVPRAALAAAAAAARRCGYRTAVAPRLFRPGPWLVRHRYHQPRRSRIAQGRTLHHRGIRFDLRCATRLDRQPRSIREHRHRTTGAPTISLAI